MIYFKFEGAFDCCGQTVNGDGFRFNDTVDYRDIAVHPSLVKFKLLNNFLANLNSSFE